MYGNGAATGMATIAAHRKRIPMDQVVGLTACAVVVAGATMPITAACRSVATAAPSNVTTTLACVLSSQSDDSFG